MLHELKLATFATLVGNKFCLYLTDGKAIEVELIAATKLPVHPGRSGQVARREPFSLLFRGPKEIILPQRIYPLEQETLGKLEIFLVPIGPDAVGQRYEAVFN